MANTHGERTIFYLYYGEVTLAVMGRHLRSDRHRRPAQPARSHQAPTKVLWIIWVCAILLTLGLFVLTKSHKRYTPDLTDPRQRLAVRIGTPLLVENTRVKRGRVDGVDLKFDGDRAFTHVRKLVSFGARVSGSVDEDMAAEYIELSLVEAGYSVRRQAFRAPNGKIANNIIAEKPAALSPAATTTPNWAALGAHYDTVSGTSGANDNASGVAVVLETARVLKDTALPYSLSFILFSSEENENPTRDSYAGSLAFVGQLSRAQKNTMIGFVNIDMVGWPRAGYSIGNLKLGSRQLFELGVDLATERGAPFVKDRGYSIRRSDHQSFEKAGIPTVSFGAAAYPYHHKRTDSLDKIDPLRLETIGSLIAILLKRLDHVE